MKDNMFLFIIAGIGACYFLLIQYRRYRWRAMANRLGAKHVSTGLFKVGRIKGLAGGRKYFVATVVRNSGVMMPFEYKGIPIGFHTRFFTSFPDWSHAFTATENRPSIFVTDEISKGPAIQLPEVYQEAITATFQELRKFYQPEEHGIGDGYLWVRSEGVEFKCSGIFYDSERIRRIVSLLVAVAELMEKSPLMEIAEDSAPRSRVAP